MTRGAERFAEILERPADPTAAGPAHRVTDADARQRSKEGSLRATIIEFRWRSGTRVQPVLYIGWSYLH